MIEGYGGAGQSPSKCGYADDERDARLYYTEAAVIIDKIIRGYSVCDDGKRIAWRAAKLIQRAIDAARNGE